jgi:ferredoxin-NADP reductase
MSQHLVRIRSIKDVTHDTICIATDKPENYNFKPGQATRIALDRDGWRNKKRPFTFTSLPEDDHIEFIIKTYPEHDGTTDKLLDVREGEKLILFDIFGTIVYRGEGVFIAGGAGITPFISILRDLHKKGETGNNRLIFANKTRKDIMLREDFENMLGDNFLNILSEEKTDEYAYGFVTADYLKEHVEDFNKYFYICGPPVMTRKLEQYLAALNVDKTLIVKEEF